MPDGHSYDLFVSHADADRTRVEGYFVGALADAGLRTLTAAEFTVGAPFLQELERAIKQSKRTLLVLSPAYLASELTQFEGLVAQHYGLDSRTWPVIPLHLGPEKIDLPLHLRLLVGIDAVEPSDWPAAIERICIALKQPSPIPPPPPACPYPGMVPFREEDAALFFGRDRELENMLRLLRLQRALYLIGPSGCGKSSFVSAGLLPKLRTSAYFLPDSWLVRTMRPGDQPMHALVHALEPGAIGSDDCGTTTSEHETSTFDPGQAVTAVLATEPGAEWLLLVVDQFEELFTQCAARERTRFLRTLQALQALPHTATLVVLRADFFGDLIHSDLWPIEAGQRMEIGCLRGPELRAAIRQPAADAGVYLEPELLERLTRDAAAEPGSLPLVQETMRLLWGKMQRRFIPLSAYEQMGGDGRSGLAVAVAARADATLADMPPLRRAIARRILLRLIQFGDGRADTRRQQPIAALRSAEDDPVEFDRALEKLCHDRLLTRSHDPRRGPVADLAHEVLIDGWPTFQSWLKARSQAEQTRRRLEGKVEEWARLGRHTGGLLDATELAEADEWLAGPDAQELGCSADLLDLLHASRQAINPGWHTWGVIGLMAAVLSLTALFSRLLEGTAHLPSPQRVAAWVVPLIPVAFILAIALLQHRGDPYLGQKLSQRVARSRSLSGSIIAICVVAAILWTKHGSERIQINRYCLALGYLPQDQIRIAVLQGNVNKYDVEAVNRVLSSHAELRSWITTPENLDICSDYFDYSLTLERIQIERTDEVGFSGLLKTMRPGAIPRRLDVTPGRESCGMPVQVGRMAVEALNVPSAIEVVHASGPVSVRCEPYVLHEEAFDARKQGRFEEAESKFLRAIELDENYALAYANLGVVYIRTHRFAAAIRVLERANELRPHHAPFLIDLAHAYSAQGHQGQNFELAESYLFQALEADPENVKVYNNLSVLYRNWRDYKKARFMLTEAWKRLDSVRNKQNKDTLEYLLRKNEGILLYYEEDLNAAARLLNDVDRPGQTHEEEILFYLALCHTQLLRHDQACGLWQRYSHFFTNPSNLPGEPQRQEDARQSIEELQCASKSSIRSVNASIRFF